MNEYTLLLYYFLSASGSIMCLAQLSGAFYNLLTKHFGWQYRAIGIVGFAFASIVCGIATMSSFAGFLYTLGGMEALKPLVGMMFVVGIWSIVYGSILAIANLAGIRILPPASESCTSADHAILSHYSHFNSDLCRCNRCGTFVNGSIACS